MVKYRFIKSFRNQSDFSFLTINSHINSLIIIRINSVMNVVIKEYHINNDSCSMCYLLRDKNSENLEENKLVSILLEFFI